MFGLVPFKMNKDLNNSNTMFNDLFGDFFNDNLNMNTAIKADIRETKEAYILEADLPGMRKEDINLEYNQNYLTIHAHKNETKEDKKENYIRKERHYGEVSRSFYVGNIDKSAISAKFENGVLKTNGGRVLSVIGRGKTVEEAREDAYANVKLVNFKDSYCRTDIGIYK